jgi:hypothetical protein
MARQLCRTLITLDHDYFDDAAFPPGGCGGVIVVSAPDEHAMAKVLGRVDRFVFGRRKGASAAEPAVDPLPLRGQKLHAHADWGLPPVPAKMTSQARRRRRRSRP